MRQSMKHGSKKRMGLEYILLRLKEDWVYLKEDNSEEITLRFWQEVYDENNILREIHEKYPIDKGHKKL